MCHLAIGGGLGVVGMREFGDMVSGAGCCFRGCANGIRDRGGEKGVLMAGLLCGSEKGGGRRGEGMSLLYIYIYDSPQ